MKKRIALILLCTVLLECFSLFPAAYDTDAVDAKVDAVAAECRAALETDDEYEIALWLHNWLITHANYDYTYSYYDPDGVLLYGEGVCMSYAEAYRLLLAEFGIESVMLSAPEMNHAWNLVRLYGEWTHVDCTWDDPGTGGHEYAGYFAIGDAEIGLDHDWDRSEYPAAVNVSRRPENVDLSHPLPLSAPIKGMEFAAVSADGDVLSRMTVQGTVLLVIGSSDNAPTVAFLRGLAPFNEMLRRGGVTVLCICPTPEDAAKLQESTTFQCAYELDCGLGFSEFLTERTYYQPYLILQDGNGMAHWTHSGAIYEVGGLVAAMLSPLPRTETNPPVPVYVYSDDATLKNAITQAIARQDNPLTLCRADLNGLSPADVNTITGYVEQIGASFYAGWSNCSYLGNTIRYTMRYAHQHVWTETGRTEPSCTAQGSVSYACTCGETKSDPLPKTDHVRIAHDGMTPSCTEAGWAPYETCANCPYSTYRILPALGHRFEKGVCTRCGEKDPGYTAENPFTDVKSKDWFYSAVLYAYTNNLFKGTTATTFDPNGKMTRAMLVSVLWRSEGEPIPVGENPFTDVNRKQGSWYITAVTWAAENSIVGGIGGGKFDPNGNISREQIASILYRYHTFRGGDVSARADLSVYPDEKAVSSWARTSLAWANARGLITGAVIGGQTVLNPQGDATRAEVASILYRYLTK